LDPVAGSPAFWPRFCQVVLAAAALGATFGAALATGTITVAASAKAIPRCTARTNRFPLESRIRSRARVTADAAA
jgi:hypothetical protein